MCLLSDDGQRAIWRAIVRDSSSLTRCCACESRHGDGYHDLPFARSLISRPSVDRLEDHALAHCSCRRSWKGLHHPLHFRSTYGAMFVDVDLAASLVLFTAKFRFENRRSKVEWARESLACQDPFRKSAHRTRRYLQREHSQVDRRQQVGFHACITSKLH